jgi:hypothetical protein
MRQLAGGASKRLEFPVPVSPGLHAHCSQERRLRSYGVVWQTTRMALVDPGSERERNVSGTGSKVVRPGECL